MRANVEGIVWSGVFIFLAVVTAFTPLSVVTTFLLPLPFIIVAARQPFLQACVVVLICTLIVSLIAVPLLFSALLAGSSGLLMGVLYRRQVPAYVVFFSGTFAIIVNLLCLFIILYSVFDINIVSTMQQWLSDMWNINDERLAQLGLTEQDMQAVEEWMQSIALMLPVMIAYFSMTTAMLNHWFARRILSRIGTEVSAFPPLQEWKLPRSIVYYYVLAVVLLIFTGGREGNFGMVLENIRMLLGFMLMIQGLSFVVFSCIIGSGGKGWR